MVILLRKGAGLENSITCGALPFFLDDLRREAEPSSSGILTGDLQEAQ
jgi:hypothetical protein